jgi:hypothetical protein
VDGLGGGSRTAIGADGGARTSSVRDFCAAVVAFGTNHDTTGRGAAMVTPPDIEARILRYYHAEKWTPGTIARQSHVHHSVVRRVLTQAGLPKIGSTPRKSKIDAYLPFIHQTLEAFPSIASSALKPTLLGFAGQYRYEPQPVAIARGNEKGRVERAIRYVRDGFFAARSFTDLDDLDAQAAAWCMGPAADWRCPASRTAPSARSSPRNDRGCSHCLTIPRRCSSRSRSRSARPLMSASI